MLEKPLIPVGRDIWDASGNKIRVRVSESLHRQVSAACDEIALAVNHHDELVGMLRFVLERLDFEAQERGENAVFTLNGQREDIRHLLRRVGVEVRKPGTKKTRKAK